MVYEVIEKADVILEILDARFITQTRNPLVEEKIKKEGKILIHVINKCDFLPKKRMEQEKRKLENAVFVSASQHLGTRVLKEKIYILAKRKGIKEPLVGVVGYPNVGKSSLINALRGGKAAPTSSESGYTKALQKIRISKDIMMLDTPGVMPKSEQNPISLVLIAAKNPTQLEDPDLAVFKLMEDHPGMVEEFYGVDLQEEQEAVLEAIAMKLHLIKKGNKPDYERAARKILYDWQQGKIQKF